jgi:hypothetical protein
MIELTFLDKPINANKSLYIRIGARHKIACADIIAHDGAIIPGGNVCRYLSSVRTSQVYGPCVRAECTARAYGCTNFTPRCPARA